METERRWSGEDGGDGGSGRDKRKNIISQVKDLGLSPGTPLVGHMILGESLNPLVTNDLGRKTLSCTSSFWFTRASCPPHHSGAHSLLPGPGSLGPPPGCDVTPKWFRFECLPPWAPGCKGTNDHNLKLFLNSSYFLVNCIIRENVMSPIEQPLLKPQRSQGGNALPRCVGTQASRWMDTGLDGWSKEYKEGRKDGWMAGWLGGREGGWMDGERMDGGWTGCHVTKALLSIPQHLKQQFSNL